MCRQQQATSIRETASPPLNSIYVFGSIPALRLGNPAANLGLEMREELRLDAMVEGGGRIEVSPMEPLVPQVFLVCTAKTRAKSSGVGTKSERVCIGVVLVN